MSDPRNVAHDKKVKQEKEHHKPASTEVKSDAEGSPAATAVAKVETPGELEKSLTVLSKLKEMEFHSRANIETLAGLTMAVEDELKQEQFSEPFDALYSAQDGFHTKITELIGSYEANCETLKPSA